MMDAPSPLILQFTLSAAASLVTGIAETALLVLVTALGLRVLPAVSAEVRSRIWGGVFLAALILPLLPRVGLRSAAQQSASSPFHLGSAWAVGLLAAWVLLSVLRGVALIRSAIRLAVVARRALPLDPVSLVTRGLDLNSSGWLGRKVVLCSSNDVDAPSVVGFFSHRILLPAPLIEKISSEDLLRVVLHEMEHLRRNDDWINLLQKIGLVLLPVSPVLLWVERRLCLERELACDDGVLRLTGSRKAYASCLTNLAEQSLLRRGITLALGAWQKKSELSRRILRILEAQPRTNTRRSAFAAVIGLGLVATSTALLYRAPQWISFGDDLPIRAAAVLTVAANAAPGNFGAGTAHMTLANAVMSKAQTAPAHRLRLSHSVKSAPPRTAVSPWLVLTGFHEAVPIRFRQAALEETSFTYAAIPLRNGWLVIQL